MLGEVIRTARPNHLNCCDSSWQSSTRVHRWVIALSKTKLIQVQTRALSQNVTNAPEGRALTPNLKNVKVTVQKKLHYCGKCSGQNLSMKINKEHNSKSMMPRVIVLVHCNSPQ